MNSTQKPHPVDVAMSQLVSRDSPFDSVLVVTDNGHGQDIGPAPQWTTTPPTEPGFYWCRKVGTADLFWEEIVEDEPETESPRFEWWPVRIEEPPR